CNRVKVPELLNGEVHQPSSGFDKKAIETLLKGNTGRKPRQQLPVAGSGEPVMTSDTGVELLSKMHRDMQTYWAWQEKHSV
ncbi:hypothetical protein A2U01_0082299, partial [Trifolium medium]|nr:hypothetical protein [Trifolium medium]